MKFRIFTGIAVILVVLAVFSITAFSQHSKPSGSADVSKPAESAGKAIRTGQTVQAFSKKITKKSKGQYLLYLPEEYGKEDKAWPVILFLHGSGERYGTGKGVHPKLDQVGLPKTLQKGGNFPFIVITPQCPGGKWWSDPDVVEMVMAMLDEVCQKYKVDKDRIYLTGLSMGGFGTWSLAQQYPKRFAALVPICGGGVAILNDRLRKIPVWVFHGAKDKRVPVRYAYEMAGTLKQMGGNVQLTVFPNGNHFVWDQVYTNPKLYEWLLQQKLPSKEKSHIKRVKSSAVKKAAPKTTTTQPAGRKNG